MTKARWPRELTVGPCGRLGHVVGHIEDPGEWWCVECCDFFRVDEGWRAVA